MRRLQAGEDSALNELMAYWELPVTAYLQRYTGIREDAVDLALETFVRLYKSRASYQETAKFSTWLFTIATNLARNHQRWKKRHPSESLEALPPGESRQLAKTTATETTPRDHLARQEQAAQVRAAIAQLPAEMREAILLSEYQDLSHAAIAEIQNCTPKAIEAKLYRARQLLRERLFDLQ
jgi:RNA polymerase sigma-70 factor (ECF subfamily)